MQLAGSEYFRTSFRAFNGLFNNHLFPQKLLITAALYHFNKHNKVNLHKTSNVFSVDFQELLQIS